MNAKCYTKHKDNHANVCQRKLLCVRLSLSLQSTAWWDYASFCLLAHQK